MEQLPILSGQCCMKKALSGSSSGAARSDEADSRNEEGLLSLRSRQQIKHGPDGANAGFDYRSRPSKQNAHKTSAHHWLLLQIGVVGAI